MYLSNGELHVETSSDGARTNSLRKSSRNFFYPQQIVPINGVDKMRGGMHICSPIFDLPEGKGIFSLAPPHGELRDESWSLRFDKGTKDGIPSEVTECEYFYEYAKWDTLISYRVFYRLRRNYLEIKTTMTNVGLTSVPIELGWHPYFNAPKGGTIRFASGDLPDISINKAYGSKVLPATGLIIIELNGIGTVEMMLYEGFRTGKVCIWTDWARKYFCVEPLLSYHEFDTENGVYLQPEKTFTANFVMRFMD